MKKSKHTLATLTTILGLASPLSAGITILGDHTKTTDGDETFSDVFNSGTEIFNYTSGDVFVVFDLTFTNPTTPGTLDTSQSYGGYSHSVTDIFGQAWEQNTIGLVYYGQRNDIANTTITLGTTIKMVAKYELNGVGADGDTVKFWVNPTLGTGTEGTPDDADPARIWGDSISSDQMRFRRGNSSENSLAFADVTIYSGGDSPFAVVPEPSSAALLGLGGLALILRRRK